MRGSKFNWKEHNFGGEKSHECSYKGLTLFASTSGSWAVWDKVSVEPIVSWRSQVKGSDLQDAQRRAQAAAMVLHQLSSK